MPDVVRLGDKTSHGGTIVSASENHSTNGIGNARLGDAHACPIHGINSIVTASEDRFVNSRGQARIGDLCACGAVIISGSENTVTDG